MLLAPRLSLSVRFVGPLRGALVHVELPNSTDLPIPLSQQGQKLVRALGLDPVTKVVIDERDRRIRLLDVVTELIVPSGGHGERAARMAENRWVVESSRLDSLRQKVDG